MAGGPMITCVEAYARMIETRADRLEERFAPDRVQAHSRLLPTEEEQGQAKFAARQLRIAADDVRNDFHEEEEPAE